MFGSFRSLFLLEINSIKNKVPNLLAKYPHRNSVDSRSAHFHPRYKFAASDGFINRKRQQRGGRQRKQRSHGESWSVTCLVGDETKQRRTNQAADLPDHAPKTEETSTRIGRRHVSAQHLHAAGGYRMAAVNPQKTSDE